MENPHPYPRILKIPHPIHLLLECEVKFGPQWLKTPLQDSSRLRKNHRHRPGHQFTYNCYRKWLYQACTTLFKYMKLKHFLPYS